jgi:cardiolipin synthase
MSTLRRGLPRRTRHGQFQGFPHSTFPPIRVGDNTIQLYSYGRDLYDAMLHAIDTAQESVYLESFLWKNDAVGQDFKARLARKAAEGVEVYVIFDWFGNLVVPAAFKAFPPPIHTLVYRGIRRPRHLLDPRRYALEHRKLLVVDGCLSFLGGYNIGSLFATQWRDTHLRTEGPGAAQLAQAFADFWNSQTAAHEHITRHYPRQFDPLFVPYTNNAARLSFPIRDMYISAIDRAEQHIHLTNAYFIPDRVLLARLVAAAQRGVDVQVLVPWRSNHALADWLARGRFAACLAAGIRIFRYKAMVHAKTCTIDGQWSTIGTANLDRLSAVGNLEINAEIYSRDLAGHMDELFEHDKTNAAELTREVWSARPWPDRLSERLLAPLRIFL